MSVAIRLYQNEEKHQKPLELSSILAFGAAYHRQDRNLFGHYNLLK